MAIENLMHDEVLHRFVSIKKFGDKTYKKYAEKYYENLMEKGCDFSDEKSLKKFFETAFLFGFYFGILNDNFGDLYEDDVFNSFSEVKDSVFRGDILLRVLFQNEFSNLLDIQDICSDRLVSLYKSAHLKDFIIFSFLLGCSQSKEIVIPVPKKIKID
ncbi:MAG: hypothetical protein IKU41_05060 [Clostridia bacterium]|nr:hypothetical protein [Clostridia bacterium]